MLLPLACLTLLALPGAQDVPQTTAVAQEPAPSEGAVRYTRLLGEFQDEYMAWIEKVQAMAAEAEAEGRELTEFPEQPHARYIPRFLAAAEAYAGSEDAVPFLTWVVDNGWVDMDAIRTALAAIEKSHLASPKLEGMLFAFSQLEYLLGEEEGRAFAVKVEEKTPSPMVRAMAAFAARQHILQQEPIDGEAYRAARAHVMALVAALQDTDAEMAQELIVSEILVREEFGVGMTAPDIAGVDLDGVAFKLSDSKGRVILLDFWGDW